MSSESVKHPAPFSTEILAVIDRVLPAGAKVLDPFAGVGLIHSLRPRLETFGIELEREWAKTSKYTKRGTALATGYEDGFFDAIATSPCLAQQHRVLTDDLRWVPVGDIHVGDRLLSFEEHGAPGSTGQNARRRWQRAEVVRSVPRKVECVRVVLANGDEIITTPEHPWLAQRYSYGGRPMEWVPSAGLMGSPGIGHTKGRRLGERRPYYVHHQVAPWEPLRGYEAGWLAGMFDGEGSLSLGVNGSPKLVITQVDGPVMDRAEAWLERLGFPTNRITRKPHPLWQPEHRQPVSNLYVVEGFPGILRALGQLRPIRLLDKWENLDVSSRTVSSERVQVMAVEPAGKVDIQEIETSTGTYIGEGYLHHNCYGNRMADHHDAKDASYRRSYKHVLGRDLTKGSSGAMQWGDEYRAFHERAWGEAVRVLKPGGRFVLNIKDHVRDGQVIKVSAWHVRSLQRLGLHRIKTIKVGAKGFRLGENRSARVDHENVFVFIKEGLL